MAGTRVTGGLAVVGLLVGAAMGQVACDSDSDNGSSSTSTSTSSSSSTGSSGGGGSGAGATGGSGGAGGSGGMAGAGGQGGAGGGTGPAFGELYGACTDGQFDSCNGHPQVACYSIQDAQANTIASQCLYWIDEQVCSGANDDASCAQYNPYAKGLDQCTYFPDPFWTCTLGCNTTDDCPDGLTCLAGGLNGGTPELMCIPQ